MKYCPKCIRTYDDDTFAFCLEDGSVLLNTTDSNVSQVTQISVDKISRPTEYLSQKAEQFTEYLPKKTEPAAEYLSQITELNRNMPKATVAGELSLIIAELEREIHQKSKYPQEAEISAQIAGGILTEGLRAIARGKSPKETTGFLSERTKGILNLIDSVSQPLNGINQISRLIFNACRDEKIAELMTRAVSIVGVEGTLTAELGHTETTLQIVKGIRFDRGFYSSDPFESGEIFLHNLQILIINGTLTNANEISPIFGKLSQTMNRELLIIIQEIEENVLNDTMLTAKTLGLNVVIVKAPGFGDRRTAILQDIGILTGAKVFVHKERDSNLASATVSDLGKAVKAVIDRESTTIVGLPGREADIAVRIDQIKKEIKETNSEYDREKLQERLDKIFGNAALFRIGGFSDDKRQEKLELFARVRHFLFSGDFTGIVPEAYLTLLYVAEKLREPTYPTLEITDQMMTLADALEIPFKKMLENANRDADKTLQKLRTVQMSRKYYFIGNNPMMGNFADLINDGMLIPTSFVKNLTETAIILAARKLENFRSSDEIVRKFNN